MNVRESLVCALEKLIHDDCQELTLSSLSSIVGISRSTIYKYYPDIVLRVRNVRHGAGSPAQPNAILKAQKLSHKVKELESMVLTLTNLCSSQLSEISEMKLNHQDAIESLKMKIEFLESELNKSRRPNLRAVDKS